MSKPNCKQVPGTSNMFIVRTQAGFKKALKGYDLIRHEVKGHPVGYPALISITSVFTHRDMLLVEAVNLDRLRDEVLM